MKRFGRQVRKRQVRHPGAPNQGRAFGAGDRVAHQTDGLVLQTL